MKLQIIEVFTLLCLFALANCSFSKVNEKYDSSQRFETKSLYDVKKNCRFCKWLIDNYKWGINNSLTVKEVQNSIIETCDIFKQETRDLCVSFILGVGEIIINDIIKNKNTIKICQKLDLCYFNNYEYFHLLKINKKYETPPNFYDCKMCTKHIGYLEQSMETSLSSDFVLNKLKNGCNVFKHFQKQNCIVYYDQVGVHVIKLLLMNDKPENICRFLSYCKSNIERKVFKSSSLSNDPSNDCKICKVLISSYEETINNDLPILEIQKAVVKVCDIYNDNLRQQCISFYSGKGLDLIKAIVKKEDPTKVCQIINLCLNVNEVNQYKVLTDIMTNLRLPSLLDNCTTCTNIITWFQTNMNLSKTPEEDQRILLGICIIFKHPYDDGCISSYTGVGYDILKYILNRTDPETICKHFHICQSRNLQSNPMKVFKSSSLSNDPSNDCKICKVLISSYEETINDDLPILEIQKAVVKVCDIYNDNLRQQCISFYSGKGLDLIKAIVKKEDPTKVCQIINLCLNVNEVNQYKVLTDIMINLQLPSLLDNCTTCTNIITWFQTNMNLSKTPEEDQRILLGICVIFKHPYDDGCISSYTGVGYDILKYILNRTDPETICKHFHICQSRNLQSIPMKVSQSNSFSNDPYNNCEICKYLVTSYEATINDDLPILEIQKSVIKICDIFNEDLRKQCISFYSGQGLDVIKAIIQKEDPTKVCQILHLCLKKSVKSQHMLFTDIMSSLKLLSHFNDCKTCIDIMTWDEMNMNLSKTVEEVQHLTLQYCEIFKCPYHDQCVKYFTGIGNEIIKYILNKTDPETICKNFHLCQSRNIQ